MAWVASPFFDKDQENSRVTAALCKLMERGGVQEICFCVPAIRDYQEDRVPCLAAPKALVQTLPDPEVAIVEMLPAHEDQNPRPWHAKMLALQKNQYSALMVGSSNFTCAGMGVGSHLNAEANLLTIVDRVNSRGIAQLEAVWPEMKRVDDPESAKWLGAQADQDEEEQAKAPLLPAGFLSATYRAGESRLIILSFDPGSLPGIWRVCASGPDNPELLSSITWNRGDRAELPWTPLQPPVKLVVQWDGNEALLPLNVEDSRQLPPPASLEKMTADDMLGILAATDPSAAYRAWAKQQQPGDGFDPGLDSAIDLDPLRRYDLQATFLHRIRRRARVLAQLRANLQRPVWSRQALDWRLRGLVGIESLSDRLVHEFAAADGHADEALLTLADFLIVLREVDYQPTDGALPKKDFGQVFKSFLRELASKLGGQVETHRGRVSQELMHFWERVLEKC